MSDEARIQVASGPAPETRMVHRCSECFAGAIRGPTEANGSTALACPNHGFDRQIVTVPGWVEDAVIAHPDLADRYVQEIGYGGTDDRTDRDLSGWDVLRLFHLAREVYPHSTPPSTEEA